MKTQISRDAFRPDKGYSGVYQQQGRMLTDADWNELVDALKHGLAEIAADAVGDGGPAGRSAGLAEDPGGIKLRPGLLCIKGRYARLSPDPGLAGTGDVFPMDRQADFPGAPALPTEPGRYLFYADLWERAVTGLQDGDLLDPALHGADTCTRSKPVLQIKWCSEDRETRLKEAAAAGTARLSLRLRRETVATDPCDPCADEISFEQRTGNSLFRCEVHDVHRNEGLAPVRIVLKWSLENGAEQAATEAVPEDFSGDSFVYEFASETSELHMGWHPVRTDSFPDRPELAEQYPEDPASAYPDRDLVRRWDGYCDLRRSSAGWSLLRGRDGDVALSEGARPDEAGRGTVVFHSREGVAGKQDVTVNLETMHFTLQLDDRELLIGDYWLVPVREAVHSPGEKLADLELPAGIGHGILILGRGELAAGSWKLQEMSGEESRRFAFPPLTDLDASDVGYTMPSCPGEGATVESLLRAALGGALADPGDPNPSVREILDLLLCRLSAASLPFAPACETGLYGEATTSVQQALEDICSIAAEHVAYTGSTRCPELNRPEVATVQDALDELCRKLDERGCRIPVGAGGVFPTVDRAVSSLRERGVQEICLCLLPGDHEIQPGFTLEGKGAVSLDIQGCGEGSRVRVRKRPWKASGLLSLRLAGFALTSEDLPQLVDIQDTGSVILEGLRSACFHREGSVLLSVSGAGAIRVRDCLLEAPSGAIAEISQYIFKRFSPLAKLFERPDRSSFRAGLPKAARELAGLPDDKRKELLQDFQNRLQGVGTRLSDPDRELYASLITRLSEGGDWELISELVQTTMHGISLRNPGTVLAVRSREARVRQGGGTTLWASGNELEGIVGFYGPPGTGALDASLLNRLQGLIKQGRVGFSTNAGDLHVSGNRIVGVRAGERMAEAIKQIVLSEGGTLPELWQSATFRDNTLLETDNELFFYHLGLAGTSLAARKESIAATVAGLSAAYTGNTGRYGAEARVLDLTRVSDSAANLFFKLV